MTLLTSLPWMHSVDAKLSRAREHLATLESEVAQYLEGLQSKRTIILKLNPDQTTVKLMTWLTDAEPPPMRISAIVGDCVYNTRAALDNLVCSLVRIGRPQSTCTGRRFPVIAKVDEWNTSTLSGIPVKAKIRIRDLQPFNRPPASVDVDPIYMLNKLRNSDVHRAALLTAGFSRNTRFAIHLKDGRVVFITAGRPLFGDAFDEIPLPFPPSLLNEQTRVESVGTGVLAFREEGPWRDRPVVDVVESCLRYVEDAIGTFRPFFIQP